MARLRGIGLGSGMALGTSATIRQQSGIPLSPEVPASIVQRLASRRDSEKPEIILVVEDFAHAVALAGTIKWADVVGIVAEKLAPDTPLPGIKVVSGVLNLMERMEEDLLLLLDASNGVVLIDPDPMEIAQYQAEYDHIAPRQRIFLEEQHLPAVTSDKRTILVIAQVAYPNDVEMALEAGADALYVYRSTESLGGFAFAGEPPLLPLNLAEFQLYSPLSILIEASQGKPLLIPDDYTLASSALLEAAARAEITLLLNPREDLEGWGLAEYREALVDYEAECEERERPSKIPLLGLEICVKVRGEESEADLQAMVAKWAENGATRVSLLWETGSWIEESMGWLESLCVTCGNYGLPVIAELNYDVAAEESDVLLRSFLGVGVSGLRVIAEQVPALKQALRGINVSVCRALVVKYLQGGAE